MGNNNKQCGKKGSNSKVKTARRTSKDSLDLFLNEGILIEERIIHLFDSIDQDSVSRVIRGIQILAMKSAEPINIYISSYGGDIYAGLALYDYIRSLKNLVVRTYNIGCSMSAATIIYVAGDERFCFPNARFMFHTVSGNTSGKEFEMEIDAVESKILFKKMCDIYGKNSILSSKQWGQKIRLKDKYIDAEEGKYLGLVHNIVECD